MSTKIIPKKSTVASKVPLAGDLQIGEIALNLTDKKLYSKDGNSNIVEIGGGGSMTASEILTAIKTVDGSGSGLDADLLDGNHASAFATAAQGALADTAIQPNDDAFLADVFIGDLRLTNWEGEIRAFSGLWASGGLTVTGNTDTDSLSVGGNIFGSSTNFTVESAAYFQNIIDVYSGITSSNTNFKIKSANKTSITAGPDNLAGVEVGIDTNGFSPYVSLQWDGSQKLRTNSTGVAVTGNITVSGTVDGYDVGTMGAKLAGIEAGATADQTITAGSGLTGGGTGNVTLSHADTSSQASVNNSGATVIQDVTLDTYGHVTALGSTTLTASTIGAAPTANPSFTGLAMVGNNIELDGNSGNIFATAFVGDGSGLTGLPAGYTNSDVDTHLNLSAAGSNQVLSWTGTDYGWVDAGASVETETFTATSGQTTFVTSGYTNKVVHVYLNGVKLVNTTDYTATTSPNVVLTTGATAGDEVQVVKYGAFDVANTYTQAEVDALIAGVPSPSIELIESWTPTNVYSKLFTWDESVYQGVFITLTGIQTASQQSATGFYAEMGHSNGSVIAGSQYEYGYVAEYNGLAFTQTESTTLPLIYDGLLGLTAGRDNKLNGTITVLTPPSRYDEFTNFYLKSDMIYSNGSSLYKTGLTGSIGPYAGYQSYTGTAYDSIRLSMNLNFLAGAGKINVYGIRR